MIGYLDMASGISGDMFLGCLVDAGWPVEDLRSTIASLGLPDPDWRVDAEDVMRGALRATRVHVHVTPTDQHRHLSDIEEILGAAQLDPVVRDAASAVFRRLAAAEASVHGTTVEEVHFHEVGALDAIIDIVGAAAGLAALGVEKLHASPLPLGPGWTQSQHGRIPLPAPATLALLAAVGAPTRPAPGPGELVTPTGAALVAELCTFGQPVMELNAIAVGAGGKEFEWPNVARLWLGTGERAGSLVQIEANIDDMNPELYGAVRERAVAAGAIDIWTTAIQMKKDRPGILLSILTDSANEQRLADLILRETTTLGMRVSPVRRHEAARKMSEVTTPYGTIRVKLKFVDGQISGAKPEYDDCVGAAKTTGVAVRQIYEEAQTEAHLRWLAGS